MHSFESAVSEKSGGDAILDVDVLPNRGHDCLSHYGLAKEIGVLTKKPVKKIGAGVKANNLKSGSFVSVAVKEKNLCPRYEAKILTDVKMERSPKWLENELLKFNIKPHNNVVDILNYAMLETGQPMHAFDYDKLEMKKIIVRRAKKGETINTLDGGKYDLDEKVLVIADGRKPVAIAGIKGGLETGVSFETKRIVIESANFEASGIRRTSRALELKTDASIRFSHGLDPNLTEFGLNSVCDLIKKNIPGAKIAGGGIDIYPKKSLPKTIKLNLDYLNGLIGEKIKPEFIKKTLETLGAKIKSAGKNSFLVVAPAIRLDLEREEDLIEEVARIYGYANLKSVMPAGVLASPERNDANLLSNKSRDILTGLGFSEVYNYSFIGGKDANESEKKELVEIQNPASEDFKYLRPDLIYNLLKNVKSNFRFFDKAKFFEIGKVFSAEGKAPVEKIGFAGVWAAKNTKETAAGEKFFEMKGNLDVLFEKLGVADCAYEPMSGKWWRAGRAARIKCGEDFLGVIGEISPAVVSLLDISGRVAAFDLDFEKLVKIAEEEREFSPISKYPAVVRDIAVLIGKEARVSEILNVIYSAGADLAEDVDLFDYYECDELPDGKKSLAFHIVYQADHTLTDEEVRREEEKIKNALVEKLNAEIR